MKASYINDTMRAYEQQTEKEIIKNDPSVQDLPEVKLPGY